MRYTPLPNKYISRGCTNLNTVQLVALRADNADIAISNLGPVTCDVSMVFGNWARFGVDRAARQILGSPLERIECLPQCRWHREALGAFNRSGD